MRFGPWEIVLVIMIVLILFGAKRIPDLMKSLGVGIKEFKTGLTDDKDSENSPQKDDSADKSTGETDKNKSEKPKSD